jgi:hypothetical protein
VGPEELLDAALEIIETNLGDDLKSRTRWRFDPAPPDHVLRVVGKHGITHYCHNVVADIGNSETNAADCVGMPYDRTALLSDLFRKE